MSLAVGMAALAVVSIAAVPARADDARCIAAFEETQRLKMAGKLVEARESALVCSATTCPPVVQKQCATWTDEIDAAIPTAIVIVQTRGGAAPADLHVEIDGRPVPEPNSGRAMPFAPGPHRVHASARGHADADTTFLLAEGDKRVKVAVVLEPAGSSATPLLTTPAPTSQASRPVPAMTWLLGGVAIAALGAGTVFELDGLARKSSLDDSGCKPDCDRDRYGTMSRSLLVGDVLIGVGIVSAVAAAVFFFTRPAGTASMTANAARR